MMTGLYRLTGCALALWGCLLAAAEPLTSAAAIPKLLDLGSKSCIPCKRMAPLLEELTKEYAGRLQVEFIDVWVKENAAKGKEYGIETIPTQIFFAPDGKELWRHQGFFAKADILAKWKELGYELGATALPKIERWAPAAQDTRAKDQVCTLCDGDISPKTAVVVKSPKGDVRLCSLHCTFILYSCLTEDKKGFEKRVSVTDYAAGTLVAAADAVYLQGADEKTGRPWTKAFASRDAAATTMSAGGGSSMGWAALQESELSRRCGFCERSLYPQDVASVLVEGAQSYGCCAHCAMGIAARTGKDLEVHQPDGLTGEPIIVKTLGGTVASVEPKTAVAWFGKKQTAEGKWVSAGCFHQGFFSTPENLRAWLAAHPFETGEMITLQQSLADKVKLTPEQIQKACKIGECAPK